MRDEEGQNKNSDLKTLIIFVIILAAIVAVIWFFGWRANQGQIIKEEKPTIIYTNVSQ